MPMVRFGLALLWDIRKRHSWLRRRCECIKNVADRLILQHHFPCAVSAATMRIAALAMYNTDFDLYSGAHTNAIHPKAFNDRGITVDGDYLGGSGQWRIDLESLTIMCTALMPHSVQTVIPVGLMQSKIRAKRWISMALEPTSMLVRSSVADVDLRYRPMTLAIAACWEPTGWMWVACAWILTGAEASGILTCTERTGTLDMQAVRPPVRMWFVSSLRPWAVPAAGLAQKYTMRGPNPPQDLISGTTRADDVDYNSTEVLSNRDSVRNLSLQGQYISGGYTFQHELGHVLGAMHGLGDVNAGSGSGAGLHPHDGGITFSPIRLHELQWRGGYFPRRGKPLYELGVSRVWHQVLHHHGLHQHPW